MRILSLLTAVFMILGLMNDMTQAQQLSGMSAGLRTEDLITGKGAEAKKGDSVMVHYTGWLNDGGKKGKKFDSSLDRGTPFSFVIGSHMVIPGWEEGVPGMKPGGKRTLYIPYSMAYGERGYPPVIPPKADLIFEVELISAGK